MYLFIFGWVRMGENFKFLQLFKSGSNMAETVTHLLDSVIVGVFCKLAKITRLLF